MQAKGQVKHFVLAFLLALMGYIIFYQGIEYWRVRKGPWQVTFMRDSEHAAAITIDQPSLAITNVQITFAVEPLPATNAPQTFPPDLSRAQPPITNSPSSTVTLRFAKSRPVPYEVPFGKCVFLDMISLPGTVTFELLGHEIQLLPRVLIIDGQEHRWQSDTTIALPPAPRAPPSTKP